MGLSPPMSRRAKRSSGYPKSSATLSHSLDHFRREKHQEVQRSREPPRATPQWCTDMGTWLSPWTWSIWSIWQFGMRLGAFGKLSCSYVVMTLEHKNKPLSSYTSLTHYIKRTVNEKRNLRARADVPGLWDVSLSKLKSDVSTSLSDSSLLLSSQETAPEPAEVLGVGFRFSGVCAEVEAMITDQRCYAWPKIHFSRLPSSWKLKTKSPIKKSILQKQTRWRSLSASTALNFGGFKTDHICPVAFGAVAKELRWTVHMLLRGCTGLLKGTLRTNWSWPVSVDYRILKTKMPLSL